MQIEPADFLRLAEASKSLAFLDIEATGLRGDYSSVLVVSIKPYGKRPESYVVGKPGHDKDILIKVKARLEEFDGWVTYYGKGFDIPMLNTRLLRWQEPPIDKRHHIDLYFTLKSNLILARRSQGHYLSWLRTPQSKMGVSAEVWNEVLVDPAGALKTLKERCESDVRGLEALYKRTRHLIRDIKK